MDLLPVHLSGERPVSIQKLLGQQVTRGDTWQYGAEDGGMIGVVEEVHPGDSNAVVVLWGTGERYAYRWGSGACFDLKPVQGSQQPEAQETPEEDFSVLLEVLVTYVLQARATLEITAEQTEIVLEGLTQIWRGKRLPTEEEVLNDLLCILSGKGRFSLEQKQETPQPQNSSWRDTLLSFQSCPMGHVLKKASLEDLSAEGYSTASFICDACRQKYFGTFMHCKECKYDLCESCHEELSRLCSAAEKNSNNIPLHLPLNSGELVAELAFLLTGCPAHALWVLAKFVDKLCLMGFSRSLVVKAILEYTAENKVIPLDPRRGRCEAPDPGTHPDKAKVTLGGAGVAAEVACGLSPTSTFLSCSGR
eukprot:TRINITY_DN1672_c0_g1_i1.p1 TRINITY_DN1672_c0_g1~~TRINITY_DN1672_c0_g1_i1.p1  ORF type:complete len:363 (-),score=41.39 TRINITY_DN1672_c0_g1_i1:1271-2359(-)